MKSRSAIGKNNRARGQAYERKVRDFFRQHFPEIEGINRTQQAREATDSDVGGVPGLWIECQSSQRPNPVAKLEQAERDSVGLWGVVPIAICHRLGAPYETDIVCMRSHGFATFMKRGIEVGPPDLPVTFPLTGLPPLVRWWVELQTPSGRRSGPSNPPAQAAAPASEDA